MKALANMSEQFHRVKLDAHAIPDTPIKLARAAESAKESTVIIARQYLLTDAGG